MLQYFANLPIWLKWLAFLCLCVVSRLLTTIYYVEDIDCLRFFLSAKDYDIVAMQPHFPGYPVYCFLLKSTSTVLGSIAVSFSLLGGVAVFIIMLAISSFIKLIVPSASPAIIMILIFINPQLWVMSNSYMPDIFGLALLLLATYCFAVAYLGSLTMLWFYYVVLGLLLGVRLSYFPFLFIPSLLLLFKYRSYLFHQASLLGVVVAFWLVPLIWLTGWQNLVSAAQLQATGHFTKWGGSVISSHLSYWVRVVSFIQSAWADGLGGWWRGRGLASDILSIIIVPLAIFGALKLQQWIRQHQHEPKGKLILLLMLSLGVYILWAFFFQNIIHKPRHVLPLLPFLIVLIGVGIHQLHLLLDRLGGKNILIRCALPALIGLLFSSNIIVTGAAINHHNAPTALSQMKDYLLQHNNAKVSFLAPALMGYYFEKHYWDNGKMIDEDSMTNISIVNDTVYSMVQLINQPQLVLDSTLYFHHDKFVNRMWCDLTLYKYHSDIAK